MIRTAALIAALLASCDHQSSEQPERYQSWEDVADELASRYALAERNENSLRIVFEYENSRLVSVVVSTYESMGQTMVDFAAALAPMSSIDTEDFLRRNFQTALGSYALDRDVLVFRVSALLDQLTEADLELYLHAVGSTVDKLEKELEERPSEPNTETDDDELSDMDPNEGHAEGVREPQSGPVAEGTCTNLGCAIGKRPEQLALPQATTGNSGRWTDLEGGVSYQVDDGIVSQLRLVPCAPLRGDIGVLEELGFTLGETEVVNLRDARELRGIMGHRLEGRGSACIIRPLE